MKVLDTTVAAAMLHVTRRTVYNLIKTGQLEAVKIGGSWYISQDTLNARLNTRPELNAITSRLFTVYLDSGIEFKTEIQREHVPGFISWLDSLSGVTRWEMD